MYGINVSIQHLVIQHVGRKLLCGMNANCNGPKDGALWYLVLSMHIMFDLLQQLGRRSEPGKCMFSRKYSLSGMSAKEANVEFGLTYRMVVFNDGLLIHAEQVTWSLTVLDLNQLLRRVKTKEEDTNDTFCGKEQVQYCRKVQ